MSGTKTLWTLLLATSLLLAACQKDTTFIESSDPIIDSTGYPDVEEALWTYFERFEAEAAERGFDIDLRAAGITGEIKSISDDEVAGQCNFQSHAPNHVIIDAAFWSAASDRNREFVVFHELGHCDLGRDHREDAHANGACQSIMRSGLGDCFDNYNPFTRETYLDELFDPQFRDEIFSGG